MKRFRDGYLHRLIPNAAFLESIIESVLALQQRDWHDIASWYSVKVQEDQGTRLDGGFVLRNAS